MGHVLPTLFRRRQQPSPKLGLMRMDCFSPARPNWFWISGNHRAVAVSPLSNPLPRFDPLLSVLALPIPLPFPYFPFFSTLRQSLLLFFPATSLLLFSRPCTDDCIPSNDQAPCIF